MLQMLKAQCQRFLGWAVSPFCSSVCVCVCLSVCFLAIVLLSNPCNANLPECWLAVVIVSLCHLPDVDNRGTFRTDDVELLLQN